MAASTNTQPSYFAPNDASLADVLSAIQQATLPSGCKKSLLRQAVAIKLGHETAAGRRRHGFARKEDFSAVADDEVELAKLLRDGQDPTPGTKKRKRGEAPTLASRPGQGCVLAVVPRQSATQTKLVTSWTRNMIVMNMPAPVSDGPSTGMQQFLHDYSAICQARYVWQGPPRSSVRNVLTADIANMWRSMREEMRSIGTLEGMFHHDGWLDPWHRPWTGGMVSYLAPTSWDPRSFLIGFEMLSTCFDPLVGALESAETHRAVLISMWLDLRRCTAINYNY
jgi:hypothetical protein